MAAIFTPAVRYKRKRPVAYPPKDLALDLNFATMTVLDPRISFTRTSLATMFDSTGKLTYVPNNLVTYSGDLTHADWSKINLTVTSGISDPIGGTGAFTYLSTASPGYSHQQSVVVSGRVINSVWMRRRTGSGVVTLTFPDNTDSVETLTTSWQKFTRYGSRDNATSWFNIKLATPGDAIDVYEPQAEFVTYETTPRTYNATTASAYYGPRLDYNPTTLAARGLLIEEARTNLNLQSSTYNTANWTIQAGTTVTDNFTTSPDGTTNAAKVVGDGTSGLFVNGGATVSTTVNNAKSVYLKGVSGGETVVLSDAQLTIGDQNCVLTTAWQRFTLLETQTFGVSALWVKNIPAGGIYMWGAQTENGPFATSYIPTTTAVVSRSVDSVSMTGVNFSDWYNQSEGTFVFQGDRNNIGTVQTALYQVDSGSYTNSIASLLVSGVSLIYIINAGTVEMQENIGSSPNIDTIFKTCQAYKTNDSAASFNGLAVLTDTSTVIPTTNALTIGGGQGSLPLNGHIRRLSYYNTRKTNAQIQVLSSLT